MSETPITLADLIEHVRDRRREAGALDQLSEAVTISQQLAEIGDHLLGHFVDEARRLGASWADVGEHLSVSKQAAQQRFGPRWKDDPDFPTGRRLSRFTDRARNVVQQARSETARLGQDRVTNDFLVLGLLAEPNGLAGRAIQALGAPLDDIRRELLERNPPKRRRRFSSVSFGRDAKKTIELSLREALRLGHNYIGTEHLLLGLLLTDSDQSAAMLSNKGVTHAATQAWLTAQ